MYHCLVTCYNNKGEVIAGRFNMLFSTLEKMTDWLRLVQLNSDKTVRITIDIAVSPPDMLTPLHPGL